MFKAKWITAEEKANKNFYMKVKRIFTLGTFKSVKIRITADDYYKLHINNDFVGQGPAPAYNFAYNWNEFDITHLLNSGENEIKVTVYYQGLNNRMWVSGDNRFGLIADVYVDGEFVFGTDKTWEYTIDNTFISTKTVGYDTAFLEDRDFRIPDSSLKNCVEVQHDYTFCEKSFPALQTYTVTAEAVKNGNTYFYDFGQEYACHLNIIAESDLAGKKIIIHCGEELNDDGTVRYKLRCNCDYEEICILKKGENKISQFDYKAFRYLEIIADEGVEIKDVNLRVRHYPFPENSAEIITDNEDLRAVFNLCKNTIKYGTQEVFVDCPTREKGQYLGDAYIAGVAHLILTGDPRMLKKAIENAAQSIEFGGEILAVSPCSYKQKIADYALLFSDLVWKYYTYTKEKDFLGKILPTCEYINNYFGRFSDRDGLLNQVNEQWNLVDWPENLRDGYDFSLTDPIGEGRHNVINAFYINSIIAEEKIKAELKIPFENKSEKLKQAFNEVFFNKKTGLYTDNEKTMYSAIHSNMLPVTFDICEKEKSGKIAEYLIKRGMCCGVYMSYFYLKALCQADRKTEALEKITSTNENGWLNMLKEGATTCFEAWGKNKKWNTSLFHPWATAPILILSEEFNAIKEKEIIN